MKVFVVFEPDRVEMIFPNLFFGVYETRKQAEAAVRKGLAECKYTTEEDAEKEFPWYNIKEVAVPTTWEDKY